MSSYQHISEDKIRQIITVEENEALQKYEKVRKGINNLSDSVAELKRDQEALRIQGKKGSEEWKRNAQAISDYNKQIKGQKEELNKLRNSLSVNVMTMAQLKKASRDLTREMEHMSAAANPDEYLKLSQRLAEIKNRMKALSMDAQFLKRDLIDSEKRGFLIGTAITKATEIGIRIIGNLRNSLSNLILKSTELAEAADGVSNAFNKIDRHDDILANLRKATKETVSDFELMKATVQAKDFNIPLQDLGKYLQFAQLKAQETGQSVEYMTQSIVTGLGRKSVMILDNLGLSAAEINAKISETGDFMKAVAEIVDKQLAEAGETYISAADRANQRAVKLANAQQQLGAAMLPLKEKWEDAYGNMQISTLKVIAAIIKHHAVIKAITVATIAFTIAMVALNNQIRTYIAQTKVAQAVTIGYKTAMTTFKGLALMVGAAINYLRGNTVKAEAMMKLFNKTCKANVFLFLASVVITAGLAIYSYYQKTKQATKATDEFAKFHKKLAEDIKAQENDIKKATNERVSEQITKIKSLRATVNDVNKSYNERKKAIQAIQRIVPGYHASINGEGKFFAANTKILDQYISKLLQAAEAEVAYEKIKENTRKIMDAQGRIDENERKIKNVKTSSKIKRGVDLDEWKINASGDRMTSDYHKGAIHKDVGARDMREWGNQVLAEKKWVDARQKVVDQDKAIVAGYTAQNQKLQSLILKNGGTGQSILNPTYDPPTSNGSGDNTDKVGAEQKEKFSNLRTSELQDEDKRYKEQLAQYREMLIQKLLTKEEYDAKLLTEEIVHSQKVLQIEADASDMAEQLQIKDQNDKQQIILQQQKNEEQAAQAFRQKQLDAQQRYAEMMVKLEEQGMSDSELKQHNNELKLEALDAYYQAALELARKNGEDTDELQQAYFRARLQMQEEMERESEQKRLQIRQEYGLATLDEQYNMELKKLQAHKDEMFKTEQEYQQAVANLTREMEEKKFQIREQYGLVSEAELYQRKKDQLQKDHEQGLLNEEEYEKAMDGLKEDHWKKRFDTYKAFFSDAVNALQQAEMDNIDAKYDAEIEAARNAGKDTTELENKKANEQLKVQKKWADVQFAIKASEIVADTAVGITKLWASPGYPMAIPLSAFLAITGAAQLASANAERRKVKKLTLNGAGSSGSGSGARVATGRESGGYMDVEREQDGRHYKARYEPRRRGFIDRPTVLVGEGPFGQSKEWVANNDAVSNPTIAPVLNLLDHAQRMGNIRTIDFNKLMAKQIIGRSTGGSFYAERHTPMATPTSDARVDMSVLDRLSDVLDRIEQNGIPASVSLSEIEQKQDLKNRSRRIASK